MVRSGGAGRRGRLMGRGSQRGPAGASGAQSDLATHLTAIAGMHSLSSSHFSATKKEDQNAIYTLFYLSKTVIWSIETSPCSED